MDDLQVGHWVVLKGDTWKDGVLQANSVEVAEPEKRETLIGTVEKTDVKGQRFWLLGQEVHVSEKTAWGDLNLPGIKGKRLKLQGYYRDAGKFSAREIDARGRGRDRIVGRIDGIERMNGTLELRIMNFRVHLSRTLDMESEESFGAIPLAPERQVSVSPGRQRDEDDEIPGTIKLAEGLFFGALIEGKLEHERNFNLDDDRDRDRTDQRGSFKGELHWRPNASFLGLMSFKTEYSKSIRTGSEDQDGEDTDLEELWGYWRRIGGSDFDLQVGRQDFDEKREWIYDEDLDAVRLIYKQPWIRAELSASTILSDGTDRDEHSDNYMLYVSNNDNQRHLAGYVIDRRDDRSQRDKPIHFGLRALGEWVPENESWAELSALRGISEDHDLDSYAFDIGTTWSPEFAKPFNLTVGYAFGSGDSDPNSGDNGEFRQTGFHDNNAKFGGVTSFRYYGELVDPELSNLGILTVGLGARIDENKSLDLVYHKYEQDEALDELRDTNLRMDPDGVHDELGWGLDLVFGARRIHGFDFEVVAGYFHAGDAFPGADDAYLGAFRVRYRF